MIIPSRYRREIPGTQPDVLHAPYASTVLRSPQRPPVPLEHSLSELTGPVYGHELVGPNDHDLTAQHAGQPLGQRITVYGRVQDENGRAVPETLIELWQANSAGRYIHKNDQRDVPLDPNFTGTGRTLTDKNGCYRFVTIRPGAYPWRNHYNAWRPAHIHFSLLGPSFLSRLVTQMYFPGDPLLPLDPIFNSIPDEKARNRLISHYTPEFDTPGQALSYRFDITLRGPLETPMEV